MLDAIGAAFAAGGARVLDRHADPDHHRAVFTLAGAPGTLHEALAAGAREAIERIDLTRARGAAPARRRARRRARRLPRRAAQRGAALRRGARRSPTRSASSACPSSSTARSPAGARAPSCAAAAPPGSRSAWRDGLTPDFGPARAAPDRGRGARRRAPAARRLQPRARPAGDRRRRAPDRRAIREGGAEGLPGVRAIGLTLAARGDVAQVSLQHRGPRGAAAGGAGRGRRAPRAGRARPSSSAWRRAPRSTGSPSDVPIRNRAHASKQRLES